RRVDPRVFADWESLREAVDWEYGQQTLKADQKPVASLTPYLVQGRAMIESEPDANPRHYNSPQRVAMALYEAGIRFRCVDQLVQSAWFGGMDKALAKEWIRYIIAQAGLIEEEAKLREALTRVREACPEKNAQEWLAGVKTIYRFAGENFGAKGDACAFGFVDRILAERPKTEDAVYEIGRIVIRRGGPRPAEALAQLSRGAIKAIEEACHREVDADYVGWGLGALLDRVPNFDLLLISRRMKGFLEACRRLGMLASRDQERIADRLLAHPALDWDPLSTPLIDLQTLIENLVPERAPAIFGKRLIAHLSGERLLRDDRLIHAREEFADRVAGWRVEVIAGEIDAFDAELRAGDLDPHTYTFLRTLGRENRRALKRLIRHLHGGERDAFRQHPSNLAWQRRHPDWDFSQWSGEGSELIQTMTATGRGELNLSLERDPEELLKMGSYVGSCLGIGGCNAHSAVANTLDANKQVVYLRDGKGAVLARQLLALSEEGALLTFDIYWRVANFDETAVTNAFLKFARTLARNIGVRNYDHKLEETYTIPSLVAREWYDDYPHVFEKRPGDSGETSA
ncbi:MAG: hypothetical protein AAF236_14165, partial [Verrucomicrobiota bacterium]